MQKNKRKSINDSRCYHNTFGLFSLDFLVAVLYVCVCVCACLFSRVFLILQKFQQSIEISYKEEREPLINLSGDTWDANRLFACCLCVCCGGTGSFFFFFFCKIPQWSHVNSFFLMNKRMDKES
jgi:hypothetical protein